MKKKAASSKKSTPRHKLGTDRGGIAKRQRKLDKNFKQSRDVREDRGTRQFKTDAKNVRQEAR
jgi:hypothetical protein